MRPTPSLYTLAAALAALLAASPASADLVVYQGQGLKDSVHIHAPAVNIQTNAGQMLFAYQGRDYTSYCVDIYQTVGNMFATALPIDTLNNGEKVAYLFETFAGLVDTNTKAAALQVAIWEVVFESDPVPWDAGAGAFHIAGNPAALSQAGAYLATVPDLYCPQTEFFVLHSPCKQDLLLPTGEPVPEPATLAILLLGGAALACRRRRTAVPS